MADEMMYSVCDSRLVAKGASGGRGAVINQMSSHGSIVKVTLFLRKGEQLYVLVGQEGASVCEQVSPASRYFTQQITQ